MMLWLCGRKFFDYFPAGYSLKVHDALGRRWPLRKKSDYQSGTTRQAVPTLDASQSDRAVQSALLSP